MQCRMSSKSPFHASMHSSVKFPLECDLLVFNMITFPTVIITTLYMHRMIHTTGTVVIIDIPNSKLHCV